MCTNNDDNYAFNEDDDTNDDNDCNDDNCNDVADDENAADWSRQLLSLQKIGARKSFQN